jgi:hypothetical protein
MRVIEWTLARQLGRLVATAPRGKPCRVLIVPIGDGATAGALTGSWGAEVYGIEPSPPSARRAAQQSSARVLCCAFEDARLGKGGWSGAVIELPDPPETADADLLERHDLRACGWIRRAATALAPGGVLIAAGRQDAFTAPVCRTLERLLAPLHVFSASSGILVVLGAALGPGGRVALHRAALADRARPLERTPEGIVRLPAAPAAPPAFAAATLTWEQAADEAERHGVWSDPAFASDLRRRRPWDIRPLTPLARGHLGQLVAAGAFDNVLLAGPGGRPLLVRGRTHKIRRTREDGSARTTREAFRTSVVTLDPATGEFQVLEAGGDATTP